VRVVSGLDSVVLGDVQIHGQVRTALRLASGNGLTSAPLIGVFGRALEAGRRIRRATTLGQRPSTASVAVNLARSLLDASAAGADQRTAVVLRAGAVASEAIRALAPTGMRVVILNRTREHRRRLAADHPTLVTGPLEAVLRRVLSMLLQCGCLWLRGPQPQLDELSPLGRGRVALLVFRAPVEPALLDTTARQDAVVAQAV
jgi:glutamyl-tRNA reductase